MTLRAGEQQLCGTERRRALVRADDSLNGLDYIEVSSDQRRLTVYLLDRVPEDLVPGNLRVVGDRRVPEVNVVGLDSCTSQDVDRDDCITIDLDRPGGSSCYRLEVVEADVAGRPTDRPHHDFDPRYWWLELDFKVSCPSDLDCVYPLPEPPDWPSPEVSYLARDYAALRSLLLDRMALLTNWTERHVPDLQLALLEVLAYIGDQISYQQDAVGTEAYLRTARLRTSVRRHARLVDYRMHEGCTAWTWAVLSSDTDVDLDERVAFITSVTDRSGPGGPVLTPDELERLSMDDYRWFEPTTPGPIRVLADRSEIQFYTWGDTECCLPAGATRATLVDPVSPNDAPGEVEATPYTAQQSTKVLESEPDDDGALGLRPGEVLVLEGICGPRTGEPGDADPRHRHAVRLTEAVRGVDPLSGTAYVEVAWPVADALPFDLCLSSTGPPPDCAPIDPVSVARGNVVLVDAGRTMEDPLGTVPVIAVQRPCEDGCPDPALLIAGGFRPALPRAPLTWRAPLRPDGPAVTPFAADPRAAVPAVEAHDGTRSWTSVPDLLASGPDDAHFVVEVDDEQLARLRFGDDLLGRAPGAGLAFAARYRVGNGTAGNVGADSLAHVVHPTRLSGTGLAVTNPLPAVGGTDPEPVADVRRLAPGAFRRDRQRAVTAADYAELAARDFAETVQAAQADLRWNGSWYEARVALDARGIADPTAELLTRVGVGLERYRRVAHDLRVVAARPVGLDIALRICVAAHHRRADVARELLDRLGNRRLAHGRLGMFHADAVTFGSRVAVSSLVAIAAAVEGVQSVMVTRLQRSDGRDADALTIGAMVLAPDEVPRVDNDPGAPEHGTLTLNLGGGL